MAKIRSFLNPSGKMDGKVYVDGVYGNHVRKAPTPGLKKNEPALKEQYSRTKLLNDLASEITNSFRQLAGSFKKSNLYQVIQHRFRKEPANNRILLLRQLKELEINPRYPLSKLGNCTTIVKQLKEQISIDLQIQSHPHRGKYDADSYYYEVILFTWNKSKKPSSISSQFSDWIDIGGDLPGFEFMFPKPANTIHWLLCLRVQLCNKKFDISALVATGMQIRGVGSFNKKEALLLKQRDLDDEEKYSPTKTFKRVVVRVKAKPKA
jgi:hypothetical protein